MFPLPQLLPRPSPLSFVIYLKQQQKTLQKMKAKQTNKKKTVRQNMPKCKNKKTKQKSRKQWSLLCVGPLSLTQGFLWSIVNMSNNNPLKKMMLSLLAVCNYK